MRLVDEAQQRLAALGMGLLAAAEPQYEALPGWKAPTKGATDFGQLPPEAQRYIRRLEEVSGVECAIISTGSDRSETIVKTGGAVARWIGETVDRRS